MTPFSHWMKAAFALALLALLAGGIKFYRTQERHLLQRVEGELSAIARLKVDQIAAWRTELVDHGTELMARPLLSGHIARWLEDPRPGGREELLSEFRVMQRYYHYADILLATPDGRVVLGLGDFSSTYRRFTRELEEALRDHVSKFTELHVENHDLGPHVSLVVPVFAETGEHRRPLGGIVLVVDVRRFLYPLVQSWPIPSETAETLLVRRDGDHALFLNDLRHMPDTALSLRIPLNRTDVPAVMAVRGETGVVHGKDYRGVEVISVILPVPGFSWLMISKVDADEALAGVRRESRMMLALVLGAAALMSALGFVGWHRVRENHYRNLYQSEAERRNIEERYGITLQSIGDAVITTDAIGRVELLNPVAESLTGWTGEEARGRPMAEIFRIINEETRAVVENPVEIVLCEGRVVGLANHTLLIARDGTERPIADSGAPIRGADGAISGVVLVFRDQTEERGLLRALRDSERINRSLVEHLPQRIFIKDRNSVYVSCNANFARDLGLTPGNVVGGDDFAFFPAEFAEAYRADDREVMEAGFAKDIQEPYVIAGEERWAHTIKVPYHDESGQMVGVLGIFEDITEQRRAEKEREKLRSQLLQSHKMESVGRLAGGVAHDFNNMLFVIIGHAEMALEQIEPGHPLHADLEEIQKAARRSADLTRQLLAFARKQTVAPKILELNHTVSGMLNMLRRLIGEDIELVWKPGTGLWSAKIDPIQIDQILANLAVNARDAIAGVGRVSIETDNVVFDDTYCSRHVGSSPGDYVMLAVSDDGRGMESDVLECLFEPFFTTKKMGQGTGLGLATVYGIVKQNEGFIDVRSEPGKGTTFRIYLPRFTGETGDAGSEASVPSSGRGETLLLAEDEESILKLGAAMLRRLGYTVLTASTPGEAVRLAETHDGEIHLLITDVVMPEMNGRDLARRVRTIRPFVKCLFMSGYPADVIARRGILDDGVRLLQKPFSMRDIAFRVQETLDRA